MSGASLKGLNDVVGNLNKAIKQIEGVTLKGLLRGAIVVRRAMDKTSPLIPVDTGNMRNSFFIVTYAGDISQGASPNFVNRPGMEQLAAKMTADHSAILATEKGAISGRKVTITLGFSAYYTAYVHEMVGANFQRPGAGAKFFQAAFNSTGPEVLALIKKEAQLK